MFVLANGVVITGLDWTDIFAQELVAVPATFETMTA
jgi:hypothetical protein